MAKIKKIVKNRFYEVLKDIDPNTKCPPQARLIVDTVKVAGGRMSREDLITALKRPPEQGGLKTNQTPERILGFYRPKLADMNVMREVVKETEVEVEVPDAPPKAEGAADSGEGKPATDKNKGKKGEQKAA